MSSIDTSSESSSSRRFSMSSPIVRSVGILLARIAFGAVFLAHGLQKFQQNGWAGPKAGFEMMDVPLGWGSASRTACGRQPASP
ncbi:DoxX family protein [Gordonia amicalis]|uniref:DoxX family protein n=1 Tax=Gordonia amicalis TaxID=89053 RepID=UPI0035BE1090